MADIIYRDDAVAFLDIDGIVIHNLSTQRNFKDPEEFPTEMDPACVEFLVKLQEQYRFKFVLSSSIRIVTKTIEDFKERYKAAGADKLVFHTDWRTPSHAKIHEGTPRSLQRWTKAMNVDVDVMATKHWRGHQIKEWLAAHPEVTSYLSVDDSPDFYPLEEENCLWVRHGLDSGGIAFSRPDLALKAFEYNFAEKEPSSVLEDVQKVGRGSRILEDLMNGFTPDETWIKNYIKFQEAIKVIMRGDDLITSEEMETLQTLVKENPAILMVVAGHYNFKINFVPAVETA